MCMCLWLGENPAPPGPASKGWRPHPLALAGTFYSTPESETENCSVMPNSLQPHGLYSPWISPGQNTGMGSLSLLQGIFPTQESNPGLLHCRQILNQLSLTNLEPQFWGFWEEQIYHPLALHPPTDSENALYNILSKESRSVWPCHLFLHLQTDKPQESAHGLLPWLKSRDLGSHLKHITH